MKQWFGLTLLALTLAAMPAQAQLIKITSGGMPVGPWYLYWPLEAHFQTPASPQYPYWPAPMTLPLPQNAGQGMGGYNPYAVQGQMQAYAPAMNGYNPYGGMGNPGRPMAGMNGYNPYGGMGGYGGMNPYQAAPTYPAGGAYNAAPTIRTGN